MKKNIFTAMIFFFVGSLALAQNLVPATSEDLSEFDQQIANISGHAPGPSKKPEILKKSKDTNFGATVSESAKKLRNEDVASKTKQGSWIGESRKNGEDKNSASANGKFNGQAPSPSTLPSHPGNGKSK
jgi:hypothetical protein